MYRQYLRVMTCVMTCVRTRTIPELGISIHLNAITNGLFRLMVHQHLGYALYTEGSALTPLSMSVFCLHLSGIYMYAQGESKKHLCNH
jgi:hypothetical protein